MIVCSRAVGGPMSDSIYTGPGLYELKVMAGPRIHFVDPIPEAEALDGYQWFKVSRDEHDRAGRGTYLIPEPVLDALVVSRVEDD
jgi:hypothetical protein